MLIAHGIFPLHFAPKRMKTDAPGIILDIRRAIEKGLQRPPLAVKGLPSVAQTPGRRGSRGSRGSRG